MPYPIEHVLPDPHTFTIIINERQRKLLWRAMRALLADPESNDAPSCEIELMESLEDMLCLSGSTGPLDPSPAVNSFVV